MAIDAAEAARLRRRMVQTQVASRGVRDERVLEAMRTVPREAFVPDHLQEMAFEDTPLPIEEGQTISQPYIVAVMAEALELAPTDRVLEIGAGSGYAAAVLSRVAGEVYALERHPVLSRLARERIERLGYRNVHIDTGDGTLGWTRHAPFDAIVVAAGGPEIPRPLLEQLAVGGRLIIPVGSATRSQELLRVRRRGEHQYEQESLGKVQFVPLIGSGGWALDGHPLEPHRASRPLRVEGARLGELAALVREGAEVADPGEVGGAGVALEPLLHRVGEARVVLIGEATHGTSEFYRTRALLTRELIRRKGFNVVAIEGDWPDTAWLDRFVRGGSVPSLREPPFSRFPTWMWRNRETQEFAEWLRHHNLGEGRSPERQVSLHGLDLYSLNNSLGVVLDYLDRVDPVAARGARVRYGCLSPWETDPATYGRAAVSGRLEACEGEVLEVLETLLERRLDYVARDGEAFFDAEQNARVIQDAERYYRIMYRGSKESWNLRDTHMFQVLEAVLAHRGPGARAVVWAHNSHVGDARATEMGTRGELNLGELARKRFGERAVLVGFGTDRGTVLAASNWDEPAQVMEVRPAHRDSYERICHTTGIPGFTLPLREPRRSELREALLEPHLERAIGVIYRPHTELASHYFQAALPAQFDEYLWLDETRAVHPLPARGREGVPDTWPFGV